MNDLHEKVLWRVAQLISIAESKLQKEVIPPNVNYNLSGRIAGKAVYDDPFKGEIRLNEQLFRENEADFIRQTVAHEVAHVISHYHFQSRGHKGYWRTVMQWFGVEPKRCHNYDTQNAARKTYECNCQCMVHKVSSIVYNRMLRGKKYACKKCKTLLTLPTE